VGKRLDKNKKWVLGDLLLSETNEYKYLGVYISRNLRDSYHVNTCLKEKGKKMKGLIQSILSGHLNVNRTEFGDVLWHSVARSGLAHGCGVWFERGESQRAIVQSVQYQIGVTLFNLGRFCKPAVEAVLGDLGWMPLFHYLDCQRVKYFSYLLALDNNRLPRQVLTDMLDAHANGVSLAWPAVQSMHDILTDRGLDGALSGDTDSLPRVFSSISSQMYQASFAQKINERSSLRNNYQHFKFHTFKEPYVCDPANFQGTRLKFKARAGVLAFESVREKWGLSDGVCKMCNKEPETLSHFMLTCPGINDIRMQVFKSLESKLSGTVYEHVWH
jgi:hypothetical protein